VDLTEIGCEGVDWIQLNQELRDFTTTVMILRVL